MPTEHVGRRWGAWSRLSAHLFFTPLRHRAFTKKNHATPFPHTTPAQHANYPQQHSPKTDTTKCLLYLFSIHLHTLRLVGSKAQKTTRSLSMQGQGNPRRSGNQVEPGSARQGQVVAGKGRATPQARPRQTTPGQTRTLQARPGQARTPQATPGQTRPDQARPDQARPAHPRPGHARRGQTRPGQARPGQTTPGQARPCHAMPCTALHWNFNARH